MQDTIINRILRWLDPATRIDKEISNTASDIEFLSGKIRLSRGMFSDIIACKMAIQRDKLVKKRAKLLAKKGDLFNK